MTRGGAFPTAISVGGKHAHICEYSRNCSYSHVVMVGDFNVDMRAEMQEYHKTELRAHIEQCFLDLILSEPTNHDSEAGMWIDLAIVDAISLVSNYTKSDVPFISEHGYFFFDYSVAVTVPTIKTYQTRSFNNIDYGLFNEQLGNALASLQRSADSQNDVDDLLMCFSDVVVGPLDVHSLLTSRTQRRNPAPWSTLALRARYRERDLLYKRARRTCNAVLLGRYRVLRGLIKRDIERAREQYLREGIAALMHCFLSERRQAVIGEGGVTSSYRTYMSGVPQGSSPGPILFSIFINSLLDVLQHCGTTAMLFADDLQIYLSCEPDELNDAIARINADAHSVLQWSRDCGLTLNIPKTQAIVVASDQRHMRLDLRACSPVQIDGVTVSFQEKVRDLGMTIARNMSWKSNVNQLSSRVHGVLINCVPTHDCCPLMLGVCSSRRCAQYPACMPCKCLPDTRCRVRRAAHRKSRVDSSERAHERERERERDPRPAAAAARYISRLKKTCHEARNDCKRIRLARQSYKVAGCGMKFSSPVDNDSSRRRGDTPTPLSHMYPACSNPRMLGTDRDTRT
ncbi:unnamed protein product [Trichogramma brassicae]|uniref:Reverse transcriptase domain-containing protein n=1 Tax=Trichogramma brassicae TaxID=86971 RepID=A0A6H5ISC1_9HYME|nr:unnamed protein product [Trichogramma brassicae]